MQYFTRKIAKSFPFLSIFMNLCKISSQIFLAIKDNISGIFLFLWLFKGSNLQPVKMKSYMKGFSKQIAFTREKYFTHITVLNIE